MNFREEKTEVCDLRKTKKIKYSLFAESMNKIYDKISQFSVKECFLEVTWFKFDVMKHLAKNHCFYYVSSMC